MKHVSVELLVIGQTWSPSLYAHNLTTKAFPYTRLLPAACHLVLFLAWE